LDHKAQQESQARLATPEHPVRLALPVKQDYQDKLEKKAHKVLLDLQERKGHPDLMAHKVLSVIVACRVRQVILEEKVKLGHQEQQDTLVKKVA